LQKIFNLGCKLNQYEGYCLLEKFANIEDLVIVNTCCVTREAEIKSLKKFRHAIKNYPTCKIIASGCACRLHPEKFAAAHEIIDNVERNILIKDILPHPDRARFFLKIEDGCNEACTYCIVAKVRDKVESKALNAIENEINWAKDLGYKEIVLVGANIGLYGIDRGSSLADLLKFLSTIPDSPRIRLSSIEPKFINREIIKLLKDLPLCRHFHIPVQSADNHILELMKRGYDVSYLENTIHLISDNFHDVAIGGDVIVGFPGEEEKNFLNTFQFIESNPFTHLHVFPYSPRPCTEAYDLGDPVPRNIKRQRLWQLKKLIARKNHQFRKSLQDKIFNIIIEQSGDEVSGLTDNYTRVVVNGDYSENSLLRVKIIKVLEDKTIGKVCKELK
jgi:threonylcarbamoyladenosine tRNA methylthiotransferase MtaB